MKYRVQEYLYSKGKSIGYVNFVEVFDSIINIRTRINEVRNKKTIIPTFYKTISDRNRRVNHIDWRISFIRTDF